MDTPAPALPPLAPVSPPPTPIHWPSVAQFGLSLFAILGLWGTAVSSAFLGLVTHFDRARSGPASDLPMMLIAGSLACMGVLLLPSAGFALARLIGHPMHSAPAVFRLLRPTWLIFLLPLVLLAGYFVSRSQSLAWLLLPPLHVLAVGLPVAWVAFVGRLGLPDVSPQRTWGIFAAGLALAPGLIVVLEVGAILAVIILLILFFALRPDLSQEMIALAQRLSSSSASPTALARTLGPYLFRPPVILAILSFWAGVVPLIEEAFKPIGVWLLAGKALTPAQGLAAGVLSGAGYAMFESLFLGSSSPNWTAVIVARMGTGIIHIFTTALTGWALASAWGHGRYGRLAVAYLVAVLTHAVWNSVAMLEVFKTFAENGLDQQSTLARLVLGLGAASPYILVGLALAVFGALVLLNRSQTRTQVKNTSEESL
jgi:hypothetical protein